MTTKLQQLLSRAHADQSGAIMLLLLAAFLVLFMVAMVLYDAGNATRDKMDVQIAADSAAFSHAVVKARSMNMIVYANVIKRMFYSYLVTYVNAWTAIVGTMAARAAACFHFPPSLSSCKEFFQGLPMVIAEGIEAAVTDVSELGIIGEGRPKREIKALERYQQYMQTITPWWAWIESTSRATGNGAMVAGTWPPPPSSVTSIKSGINKAIGTVDWALGSQLLNLIPSNTNNTDALPIARRDRMKLWKTKAGPFEFSFSNGAFMAGVAYCAQYAGSLEAIITGVQTFTRSDKHPTPWKEVFAGMQLVPAIGCAVAGFTYNSAGYLDWRINDDNFEDENTWLQSTSAMTLAYKPRAGRNADDGDRQKFDYLSEEYSGPGASELYKNEGYFALSRSELVYKQPFEVLGSGIFGTVGNLPILGDRLGLNPYPDMWSPRWKARNRPVVLPGEDLGSAVQGPKAGLDTIINDTLPYMILGSAIGIFDSHFSFSSAWGDLKYLFRVGKSFSASRMEGISK